MQKHFENAIVVITGGGRGIGRATALEFAAEGATCVLAGRRMDALHTAVQECRDAGGRGEAVHCDVVKDEDLQRLVGHTIATYGRIDVLVNNAGVLAGGRLDEIDREDIGRIVGVNVWAPMRLAQLALPHMREAKRGTIVNVSSVAGRIGVPYYAAYSASKFAMRGFSEALRREVRPDGIHVVGVYPGGTATDMLENIDFDRIGMSIATAEQVARAIRNGVRWHIPEVFVGLTDAMMSGFNEFLPWGVDFGVDLFRDQFRRSIPQAKA